ncbi:MAG: sugar kinase, partial [bacterium]|nr:sugar kinase [Candidatus Colisoma equi]
MKVKKNAKYAVACLSSMGLRITPETRMAVHSSSRFLLQATSAETNVLNVTSSLGPECLVLTRFVAGSLMAAFVKQQLRARNIAYAGPDVPQDGPWGYRHQFDI